MIQPRHFISTAGHVGFSKQVAANLMQDMANQAGDVIAQVSAQLPPDFPEHISSAIFSGLARRADKIRRMESALLNKSELVTTMPIGSIVT